MATEFSRVVADANYVTPQADRILSPGIAGNQRSPVVLPTRTSRSRFSFGDPDLLSAVLQTLAALATTQCLAHTAQGARRYAPITPQTKKWCMHSFIRLITGILLLSCAAGAQAGLDAYPNQLMFLDPVGSTSAPVYVELTNTGNTPLTVVTVTPASGRFANAGGSCGTVPFTLAAQASCTLGYTSSPQAVGTIYQYLRATTADGTYEDFTLAGEGDLADLELDPLTGQVRFMPAIPVGTISEERFVTLHNRGRVRLEVLSIAPSVVPPVVAFVRTGGGCPEPPFTINAFFSCTVGYTFTPVAVGEAQLTVNFHNTAGSPESVTFSGQGLPEEPIFASGFEGS